MATSDKKEELKTSGTCMVVQNEKISTKNGESPADNIVRGSNIPILTSHAGLNPRSKHASLSLTASLAALQAGYIYSGNESSFAGELSFLIWYRLRQSRGGIIFILVLSAKHEVPYLFW